MKELLRRSVLCALAMLVVGASANAAVTQVSGPTTVYNETRRLVFFDVAYDSVDHLYLATWGTQVFGPVNGMLFNDSGQPLSSVPFALSDGAIWSGWARVIYSPQANRFLVSYVKIIGTNHHQKAARFVTISSNTAVPGPEMLLDDWSGDSGTASGMTYSTASGQFLVTWSHYAGTLPLTFVATITAAGAQSCGPAVGPCTVVSAPNDGETNSEIDCDPVHRKCLVTGEAWGILDGSGKSAYWYRYIDDTTGVPFGTTGYYFNAGGALQDPPSVVYSPATGHFLVATGYGGTILGSIGDASSLTVGGPFAMIKDTTGTQGTGYGFVGMRYNPASGTTIAAMTTWTGSGAVQELDGSGNRVAGGFGLIPEPLIAPSNANSGDDFTVVAINNNTAGFLAMDNVFFEYLRVSMFTGAATTPPPPPCNVTPGTTAMTVQFTGASNSLGVTTDTASCPWTASSSVGWMVITGGSNGSGPGTVSFNTAFNNTGTGRSGTITVGGKTVVVVQPGVDLAAISDLTGDGSSDLVARNMATGDLVAYGVSGLAMAPLPGFQSASGTPMTNVPLDYRLVGTGDLNGDGFADLVWQQQSTGNLYVWFMRGTIVVSTSALSVPSVGTTGWQVRAIGDVNGDGRADLIFENSVTGALAIWLMNGATVIATGWMTDTAGNPLVMPDPNWVIAGAGDLNRDGRADIIWQNQVTGGLGAWTMSGMVVTTMHNLSPQFIPTDYKIGGVGDVNGDGLADIIWIKQSTGQLFVWCMSGFNASVYQGILMVPGGAPAALSANWMLVGPS